MDNLQIENEKLKEEIHYYIKKDSLGEYKRCPICKKTFFRSSLIRKWVYTTATYPAQDVCGYSCYMTSIRTKTKHGNAYDRGVEKKKWKNGN